MNAIKLCVVGVLLTLTVGHGVASGVIVFWTDTSGTDAILRADLSARASFGNHFHPSDDHRALRSLLAFLMTRDADFPGCILVLSCAHMTNRHGAMTSPLRLA